MQRDKYRRNKFAVSIRREQRSKLLQDYRDKHYFKPKALTFQQVLTELGLEMDPLNTSKEPQLILQICFDQLMKPFTTLQQTQSDEKGLIFQTAKKQNHGLLPIQKQIQFWNFYNNELFNNRCRPHQLSAGFVKKFLKKYSYKDLARNKEYQLAFINFMELMAAESQQIPQQIIDPLKDQILQWIGGTYAINLIENCLPRVFLDARQYRNIYKTLQASLNHSNHEKTVESVTVLNSILDSATYDDIYYLLSQHNGLLLSLMSHLRTNLKQNQNIQIFCQALVKFTITFDTCLIDIVRSGGGLVAAQLIVYGMGSQIYTEKSKGNQEYVKYGIMLWRIFSQTEQRAIPQYLLQDRDIQMTSVWQKISQSKYFSTHRVFEIRKQYYSFIHGMLASGNFQDAINLCSRFSNSFQQQNSIIRLVEFALLNEQDPILLSHVMQILQSLLFYASPCDQENQNQIVYCIENTSILKSLHGLAEMEKEQLVAQKAKEMLGKIQMNSLANSEIQII